MGRATGRIAKSMGKKAHILLFPCPWQGHINGMMNLAVFLARSSEEVEVTFIHSARNYARLKGRLSSAEQSNINTVALPDGLPPLPSDPDPLPMPLYLESFAVMVRGLGPLLTHLHHAGSPVSCLVSDTLLPGTQLVADAFGIPRVDFCTSSAACFVICLHLPQFISHRLLPLPDCPDKVEGYLEETMVDIIPGMPPFPLAEITKELQTTDVSDPMIQFMLQSISQVKSANRIFVNSCEEIEGAVFEVARAELGLPMYPVGPLLTRKEIVSASLEIQDGDCLQWLDKQGAASVLFVSFGSCAKLSREEIRELARGLEASEQPFLLVLRRGSYDAGGADDGLERVLGKAYSSGGEVQGQRGFLTTWAPQRAVLDHPCVGGFLSHCGWNSTLESLWMGVPLIGCPRGSEQRANVRSIAEDWKVGIALPLRAGGGGCISRRAVEVAVRTLMQSEEGREVRRRASDMREKLRTCIGEGGSSKLHIDQFLKDVLS